MIRLIYARFLLLPLLVIVGYEAGGWWNFITPVTCFMIHPVLNVLQRDKKQQGSKAPLTVACRIIEMIYVPVLIATSVWAIYQSAHLTGTAWMGFAVSTGLVNGILGFTLAHELIHRMHKAEKFAGYLLLLNNFYMHYAIEHIWGHHVYASTPKDPHTAKAGQSIYTFLPSAIRRTFTNACEIERKILLRKHRRWLSPNNRIFCFLLLQLLVAVSILFSNGIYALYFFLLQSAVAVFLLHIVNYLQHYGLMRIEMGHGQTEKMAAHHSWSSGNRLNNLSLFQLENHAHHHLHPTHPYETLQPMNGSPQYPTGYSGMIVLAMIPPIWFRIVHKRLHNSKSINMNQLTKKISLPASGKGIHHLASWKNKTVMALITMLIAAAAAGCYQQYYRTHTKASADADMIHKLQANDKYFILHLPDRIVALQNLVVKDNSIEADEANLSPAHTSELSPKTDRSNAVKKNNKDSVLIEVHLYTSKPLAGNNRISLPLADINRVDIYQFDSKSTNANHAFSTAGVVLVSIAAVTLITFAIACNCPQVYVERDGKTKFNGGMFSGAIYSTLERTDYMPLQDVQAGDKSIKLSIGNAPNEEQFINSVKLLKVETQPDAHVLVDRHGTILSFHEPIPPASASAGDQYGLEKKLQSRDKEVYGFSNETNGHGSDIILSFKRTAISDKAKLIINARNSAWSGYIFREFSSLFGEDGENWRKRQEKADPASLEKWEKEQSLPIMVYIKEGDQWRYVDYFSMAGNTAARDMIMQIDPGKSKAETIEIKLEAAYRFWDLDYAAMDFSADSAFTETMIDHVKAITSNGADQHDTLSGKDSKYTCLSGGETIALEFPIQAQPKNNMSYFLVSSGYYHNLRKYPGKMKTTELLPFRNTGAFDAFSRSRYQQVNDALAKCVIKNGN